MGEVMRWIPPFLAIAMVTACSPPPKAVVPAVTVTARPWEGWTDALVVANGIVEVVVVPSIGRIMEFRMAGDMDGPFWHDAALHGQPVDPGGGEWRNFGGDKTWPAPQEAWPLHWPKAWPPPVLFDQSAMAAVIDGETLVLSSAVDGATGLRCRREITLVAGMPEMRVRTVYQKVSGDPVAVSPWVVTQLRDPEAMCAPVPAGSGMKGGWVPLSEGVAGVESEGGLVRWKRDRERSAKVGLDGTRLVWVGERHVLRIDCERPTGNYPDKGSSTEIYTNGGERAYVELETLGPMAVLKLGGSCEAVNRYTLGRRDPVRGADEEAAAAARLP